MESNGPASRRYLLVAEANRRAYGEEGAAAAYDKTHFLHPRQAELLMDDLRRALDTLGDLGRPAVALDACGGTGFAGLKLNALGCETHYVDISEEMVRHYRRRCEAAGFAPNATCSEILSYFDHVGRSFDLIVFSSSLHHLEDPVLVLRHAKRALAPGGLIATLFDPIRPDRLARVLGEPLRLIDRAWVEPRKVFTRAMPVLRRIVGGGRRAKEAGGDELALTEDNVGHIAEFYGDIGFDDFALAREIEKETGLRVLRHDRHRLNWGTVSSLLAAVRRKPDTFGLLLQNPRAGEQVEVPQ